jgi:hypothetical protein
MISVRYNDHIKEWLYTNIDPKNLVYERYERIVTFLDEADATFFKLQYVAPKNNHLFYYPYIPIMKPYSR